MSSLSKAALVLVVFGAINWGLMGLFQVDVVAEIFDGKDSILSRIVYVLIAVSAIYMVAMRSKARRHGIL